MDEEAIEILEDIWKTSWKGTHQVTFEASIMTRIAMLLEANDIIPSNTPTFKAYTEVNHE